MAVGGLGLAGCGAKDNSARPATDKTGPQGNGGGQSRTDQNGAQPGGSNTAGATSGNNTSGGGGGNQAGGSGSP